MSKKIQLEYSADNVWFNPEQMSEDDSDRAKLVQAVALLEKADQCKDKREAENLHAQALAAISPLELNVNTASDDIFDASPWPDLVFTDQNSDVSLTTEDGSLSISYSIRFEMGIESDVTDDTWGRPNSRVTSRHFDHSNASRAFMSRSNRPYGLTCSQISGVKAA